MDRESRLLSHNKANYTRLVTQKPSNAEGANGDFAVGSTANGIALFAKINNIWYEFAADVAMEEVSRESEESAVYTQGATSIYTE